MYTYCGCRDCFETVVSNSTCRPDLCPECSEAGCEQYCTSCGTGDVECSIPGRYDDVCEAEDDRNWNDDGDEIDY